MILVDFSQLPSRAPVTKFYLFQRYWLLSLSSPLSRISFQTPRHKATPPSLPLYLPKEEKSLSKNMWRVAASQLSVNCLQFLDVVVYLPGSLVSGSTGQIPQELVSFLPKWFFCLFVCLFVLEDCSWLCLHLGLLHQVCKTGTVDSSWLKCSAKKNHSKSWEEDKNSEIFWTKTIRGLAFKKKKKAETSHSKEWQTIYLLTLLEKAILEKLLSFKVLVNVFAPRVLNSNVC